jgi:prephenate dehydratase
MIWKFGARIQTIKNNMTRLSLLKKFAEDINRASLKFELDHKRGSLAAVLNVMSDCKMNLTKFNRCKGRNAMEIFFFL